MTDDQVPGWEGSVGPFPAQYNKPHVYARCVHSGAGNCVCGRHLGHKIHVQAAPGVDVPDRLRHYVVVDGEHLDIMFGRYPG